MPATSWPSLPFEHWRETCDTLHMWTQIVGKIRLEFTPLINHWWNSTLYVNSLGLAAPAMSYREGMFDMQFDFGGHRLVVTTSNGGLKTIGLYPRTVADFYREVVAALGSLGIEAKIYRTPVEVPDPIPFDEDETHTSYDSEAVSRFWRILMSATEVFTEFRARFVGKSSPVHFFWGSFDLAVTRFSGRLAPDKPGADSITREAYSHECSSVGFWPGNANSPQPAFYAYTAPAPEGLDAAQVRPAGARFDKQLAEFIFAYDEMRRTSSPRDALIEFCQSTYEAGANLAHWDREALERRGNERRMHSSGRSQGH